METTENKLNFFLITAQSDSIRINHIKAKFDNMPQNSKCLLCRDEDRMINHIISECSKVMQKRLKTSHDCVGKVIHWKLFKKLKIDHTTNCYVYKPESIVENET